MCRERSTLDDNTHHYQKPYTDRIHNFLVQAFLHNLHTPLLTQHEILCRCRPRLHWLCRRLLWIFVSSRFGFVVEFRNCFRLDFLCSVDDCPWSPPLCPCDGVVPLLCEMRLAAGLVTSAHSGEGGSTTEGPACHRYRLCVTLEPCA